MIEGEGAGLDEMVQGVGAGLDDKVQGEGAGRDDMVQGMGAGLDKKVQAETKQIVTLKAESEDTRNGNIHAKLVQDKDKEEANKIVSRCKRPIVKDREEKKKNKKRSKTEPRRVARDRNKVQEPRDKWDEDNSQDGPRCTAGSPRPGGTTATTARSTRRSAT